MNESELFVLRLWRAPASGFRASVRRVDGDETHHFSQPEEVARFLCAAAQLGAGPVEAADAITPPRVQPKE